MRAAKTLTFPVVVEWLEGRLTKATAAGKPELEVATPPEFKNGIRGVWSPEDLLVASAASCYAVTLLAIAERRGLPIRELRVGAAGHVRQRHDARFGFAEIELQVFLVTDAGREDEARAAVEAAELGCLIAASLDVPVRVSLELRTAAGAAA
jgi:organic hydroperoxide reductase OsmC/OhrA